MHRIKNLEITDAVRLSPVIWNDLSRAQGMKLASVSVGIVQSQAIMLSQGGSYVVETTNTAPINQNGLAMELPEGLPSERRRQQRVYPSILSAVLDTGDKRWVVTIGDISLSGARILNAPPELEVGDTLCLATLLSGSDTMTVPCTIVRVDGNEAHAQLGVHFENSETGANEALDRYLHLHFGGEAEIGAPALAR